MTFTNEFRAARPAFLVPVGVLGVITLLHLTPIGPRTEARQLAFFVFALACPYLGAVVFGHEFDHQTLLLRLMEPRARAQIWAEKFLVSTFLVAAFVAAALGTMWITGVLPAPSGVLAFPLAWAWNCTVAGPWLATLTRSTLAAAGLSFAGALAQVVAVAVLTQGRLVNAGEEEALLVQLTVGWSLVTLPLGFLAWQRLQPGLAASRWSRTSTAGRGMRLIGTRPRRRAPGGNLLRKLVARQVGTALFGLGLVALLAADSWLLRRQVADGMQFSLQMMLTELCLPLLLLMPVFLVPLLAGVVSGEERRQHTEHLHLTLPMASVRREGATAGVGLLLSLLLGVLPACAAYEIVFGYSHFFLAEPVGPCLLATAAVIAFVLGWFSTLGTRTAVGAALLAASLLTMTGLLWTTLHNWAVPWLAAQLKGTAVNPLAAWAAPAWGVWDSSVALSQTPARLCLYLCVTLAPTVLLLGWIVRVARYQHIARGACIKVFIGFLILFSAGQIALLLPLCLTALHGP